LLHKFIIITCLLAFFYTLLFVLCYSFLMNKNKTTITTTTTTKRDVNFM
jgi:uncharacterized BrkB/YihY/UPF0761 family membrane protein